MRAPTPFLLLCTTIVPNIILSNHSLYVYYNNSPGWDTNEEVCYEDREVIGIRNDNVINRCAC